MADFLKSAGNKWQGGRGRGFVSHSERDALKLTLKFEGKHPVSSDNLVSSFHLDSNLAQSGYGRGAVKSLPENNKQSCLSHDALPSNQPFPVDFTQSEKFSVDEVLSSNHFGQKPYLGISEKQLKDNAEVLDADTTVVAKHDEIFVYQAESIKSPIGAVAMVSESPSFWHQAVANVAENMSHRAICSPEESLDTKKLSNCEGMAISDFINPLNSMSDVDVYLPRATFHSINSPVPVTSFLPGVFHRGKEQRLPTEPVPVMYMSLEPTLANALWQTSRVLSERPGAFIGIMPSLLYIIKANIEIEDDLEKQGVIDTLCQMSIQDENFRYNGVRICVHFATELKSLHFLEHLLARCRKEYEYGGASTWFKIDQNSGGRVALFVGELMIQLQAEIGNPTEILIQYVIWLLLELVNSNQDANIKHTVQLLKLTGSRLNACMKEDLKRIMTQIREITLQKTTSRKSRELLLGILEIQAQGWASYSDETLNQNASLSFERNSTPTPLHSQMLESVSSLDGYAHSETPVYIPDALLPDSNSYCSDFEFEREELDCQLSEEDLGSLEIAHCFDLYLAATGQEKH